MAAQVKGLWSEHFPTTADKPTTSRADISPSKTVGLWSDFFTAADKPLAPPGRSQRCLLCPKCNAAVCRLITSKTPKNPGRQFYTCPLDNKFVKWADEVHPNEFIDVPYCGGCSAGVCRVRRETTGANAGRILFMCRVKEGEGSCGYKVWQDELEKSAMGPLDEGIHSSESTINCNGTNPTKTSLVVESNQIDDEGSDIVSPMIDTSEHLTCREILSPKMGQSKFYKDKLNESSRRPHKRSRCGDAKVSGSLVSAHSLKVRLSVNSVPTKNSWIADAIRQNLSCQLDGWWGRLAFHPMPCLMTHVSKLFTYSSSSPFDYTFSVQGHILVDNIDSITITMSGAGAKGYNKLFFNMKQNHNALDNIPMLEDEIRVNSSDLTTLNKSLLGAESHNKPLLSLDVPSCSKPLNMTIIHNAMSKSISNAFCGAAERLQNDLVTLLETMGVNDHVAMNQAAEATFSALDRLLFDHQDFKKRVNDLIHCASSLAEIEQSMPTNDSHQKLVELCCRERMRLEKINSDHAEAMDVATNSKNRLKKLQEEISSTRDWLFQIESEISCCEVEMRSMEIELDEISKNKEALEGKYLMASKELESSQILFDQKKAERIAAKAAFDRARALLRG